MESDLWMLDYEKKTIVGENTSVEYQIVRNFY